MIHVVICLILMQMYIGFKLLFYRYLIKLLAEVILVMNCSPYIRGDSICLDRIVLLVSLYVRVYLRFVTERRETLLFPLCPVYGHFLLYLSETTLQETQKALTYSILALHCVYSLIISTILQIHIMQYGTFS